MRKPQKKWNDPEPFNVPDASWEYMLHMLENQKVGTYGPRYKTNSCEEDRSEFEDD